MYTFVHQMVQIIELIYANELSVIVVKYGNLDYF